MKDDKIIKDDSIGTARTLNNEKILGFKSKCCGAEARIESNMCPEHFICQKCRKPCDYELLISPLKEKAECKCKTFCAGCVFGVCKCPCHSPEAIEERIRKIWADTPPWNFDAECLCEIKSNKRGFAHASGCPMFLNDRVEEKAEWEKELDNLPYTGKTTKEFIRQLISKTKQEARCEFQSSLEKWAEENELKNCCEYSKDFVKDLKAKLNDMQK